MATVLNNGTCGIKGSLHLDQLFWSWILDLFISPSCVFYSSFLSHSQRFMYPLSL